MTGFQPLIIDNGQIERAGDRRVEVLRLNIGPAVPINVTLPTFSITRSCHRLSNVTANDIDVTTINGGEEGDVVVFFTGTLSKKLKLKRTAGNLQMDDDFEFKDHRSITLYRNATGWEEISRKD